MLMINKKFGKRSWSEKVEADAMIWGDGNEQTINITFRDYNDGSSLRATMSLDVAKSIATQLNRLADLYNSQNNS